MRLPQFSPVALPRRRTRPEYTLETPPGRQTMVSAFVDDGIAGRTFNERVLLGRQAIFQGESSHPLNRSAQTGVLGAALAGTRATGSKRQSRKPRFVRGVTLK